MIDVVNFKTFNKNQRKIAPFPEEELQRLEGKVSMEVIEFLRQEGKCTFYNDFLWTVLPGSYHDILSDWGLQGDQGYVFMRSSFGTLVFYSNGSYYALDAIRGKLEDYMDDFDFLFNTFLSSDLILDVRFHRMLHHQIGANMNPLNEDEIYGIVSPKKSPKKIGIPIVEVVNLKEHLAILAKMYGHSVTKD